jgi:uncharacterized membrane protein YtjA (UPF0391 family)
MHEREIDRLARNLHLRLPSTFEHSFYHEELTMLYWAAVFFVIALVAAVFGFGGIAVEAVGIAKILFVVFLVLFIVSLILGRSRRGPIV